MKKLFASLLILLGTSISAEAARWKCDMMAGWILDLKGRSIQLPADSNSVVVQFVPPNRMQVLQSSSDFEKTLYENMAWTQIGNMLFGQGIIQSGNVVMNVSQVLSDTESISTAVVIGDPEAKAAMGIDKCQRLN